MTTGALLIATASALLAAVVAITGGYSFRPFGIRVSSHNPLPHLLVAAAALGLAFRLDSATTRRHLDTLGAAVERWATPLTLAVAVATLTVGISRGTECACGADAHGYVAQGELWARGGLRIAQPIAAEVPWPHGDWTFAPVGFRPATIPGHIVPLYPPGLPMAMGLLSRSVGARGPFLVVPLLGALSVWLTFVFARRAGGALAGLFAAALLASSPIFLFQLVQPMSDVPAMAWWLLAVIFSTRDRPLMDAAAGVASGVAVLTRPNLVVLAPVIGAYACWTGARDRGWKHGAARAGAYAAGIIPGVALLASINDALYGSPLASGYGDVGALYSLANVPLNLWRYPSWLVRLETPFILFALAAPLTRLAWRPIALSFALTVVVLASYLVYVPFDDWPFARFLLPAIPLLLTYAASSFVALATARLPRAATAVTLMTLVALPLVRVDKARLVGAFTAVAAEDRARIAAAFVADRLPPNAVVISMQHSGSVRYYARRLTLRWEWLDAAWLDRSLVVLGEKGFSPFILLEEWEEPEFRSRYAGQTHGALDWPPRLEVRHFIAVRLYDPADRARARAGARVETVRLP